MVAKPTSGNIHQETNEKEDMKPKKPLLAKTEEETHTLTDLAEQTPSVTERLDHVKDNKCNKLQVHTKSPDSHIQHEAKDQFIIDMRRKIYGIPQPPQNEEDINNEINEVSLMLL